METSTVMPGLSAGSGFDASTHTSMVVLPGSRAGLTKLTRPLMGSPSPGSFSSAGFPTFRTAASDWAICDFAISHNAIDGAADHRVAELCLGVTILAFRRHARALCGLQRLLFSKPLQIRELPLCLFVLAAGLRQRDFRRIEIAPGQCTLLQKLLAALVELLLRIKGRLRRGGIEFRLLNLLWKTGIHCGDVGGFRLFEIALGGFHRGGQIF